jgi:hypothetical protein
MRTSHFKKFGLLRFQLSTGILQSLRLITSDKGIIRHKQLDGKRLDEPVEKLIAAVEANGR